LSGSQNGSSFSAVVDVLAAALKILLTILAPVVTAIAVLIEGFVGLGRAIGAFAAGGIGAMSDSLSKSKDNMNGLLNGLGKFTTGLWSSTKATKDNTAATEQNNKSTKSAAALLASLQKSKQAAVAAEKKLTDEYEKAVLAIQKEIDAVNQLDNEGKARWEAEHGNLKKFSSEQQKKLISLNAELDVINKLRAAHDEYIKSVFSLGEQLSTNIFTNERNINNTTNQLNMLKVGYSAAAVEFIKMNNEVVAASEIRVKVLNDLIEGEQVLQTKLGSDTEGKRLLDESNKRVAAYQNELTALNDHLRATSALSAQTADQIKQQQELNFELESWNELIGNSRKETEKFNAQWELLDKWLAEGVINLTEYIQLQDKLMEQGDQAVQINKDAADKVTEFWKAAAQSMQGAMSDFFFDIMQGNMSDLVTSFKRTIDRMVSDLLASQLLEFLVGGMGKSGSVGGLVGSLFSGFRAEGGPVMAGSSYIVGEMGPELFTPSTNGNITPNESLGQSVHITVQSLDGADTMRVLNRNRREITEMVLGTRSAYNMR